MLTASNPSNCRHVSHNTRFQLARRTYRSINNTRERIKEFSTNLPTGSVVLHQQDMRAAHPSRVNIGALFAVVRELTTSIVHLLLRWHRIRHIVHMIWVHRIDSVCCAHRIHHRFDLAIHLRIYEGWIRGSARRGGRTHHAISRSGVHGRWGRHHRRGLRALPEGIEAGQVELDFGIHIIEKLGRML